MIKCPKKLRTGPCGSARDTICEITGKTCPFTVRDEEPLSLTKVHPLVEENEALIREDVPPIRSKFHEALLRGRGMSVEFPLNLVHDQEDIHKVLSAVKQYTQLYTLPDNPLGYPHVSSFSLATTIKNSFKNEVMPHLTCKDRNLSALTSELLTASLFEFEIVLLNTGDWPSFAMPSKPVFDLDAHSLIRLAYQVFHGILPTKQKVEMKNRPRIAAGFNPHYAPEIEACRLKKKILPGAEIFFSQVIASTETVTNISRIFEELETIGLDAPVVVSLLYPLGGEEKSFLQDLGVSVSDDTPEDLVKEIITEERINGLNLIILASDIDTWIEEFFAVREILKDNEFEVVKR